MAGHRSELLQLHEQASACTRCGLYEHATQVVFGEGPVPARLMLMGEVPGDQEDIAGRPFVGPAGRVLDLTGQFDVELPEGHHVNRSL